MRSRWNRGARLARASGGTAICRDPRLLPRLLLEASDGGGFADDDVLDRRHELGTRRAGAEVDSLAQTCSADDSAFGERPFGDSAGFGGVFSRNMPSKIQYSGGPQLHTCAAPDP